MSKTRQNPQPSETVLEIGRNLHPRRYHRFKDLRPDLEADAWSRGLDWRNNPYDRFLLRREILHHLESTSFYEPSLNVYTFASRQEIAAEADRLISEYLNLSAPTIAREMPTVIERRNSFSATNAPDAEQSSPTSD